jgi:hypothetical protein
MIAIIEVIMGRIAIMMVTMPIMEAVSTRASGGRRRDGEHIRLAQGGRRRGVERVREGVVE